MEIRTIVRMSAIGMAVLFISSTTVMAEEVIVKPGGDHNRSGFEYAPPDQPSDKYKSPQPNEFDFVEIDGIKERLLSTEEELEQAQKRIDVLEQKMVQVEAILTKLNSK